MQSAVVVLAVLVVARLGIRPVSDPDAWWHVRAGEYLVHGGPFVGKDPWSPFATQPFILTQWLPDVFAFEVHQMWGWPGIAWLRCAGMLAFMSVVFWSTRRVADTLPAMIAALAGVVGALGSLSERPQIVGFVLLAATVGAWWATARDLRPRWWLIPMTWLWACCHGLWSLGLTVGCAVIVGLVVDRRLSRSSALRLSGVVGGSLMAACLTPVGPRLLLTPFEVAAAAAPSVEEWQASSVRQPTTLCVLLMLAAVVVVMLRSPARLPWWQVALLTLGAGYTLLMARTVAVGAVLAAPLLAESLQRLRGSLTPPPRRRSRCGLALLLAGVLVVAALLAPVMAGAPTGVPKGLSPALSRLEPGTIVLDDQGQSGWLLFSQPDLVPVIDLRSEVYGASYIRRYTDAILLRPGWSDFVEKSGASAALFRVDAPIADALRTQLGWVVVASADHYLLLRPGTAAGRARDGARTPTAG